MRAVTKRVSLKDRESVSAKQRLRLWLRLLRTTRRVEATLRERLRVEFDSTLPRFDVMAALYRHAEASPACGMPMTVLSQQLLVSNGNATVIVDRLVGDGLVQRMQAASDRRSFVVSLTSRGRQSFRVMADAHERWVDEALADIAVDDAGVLIGMLTRRTHPTGEGDTA